MPLFHVTASHNGSTCAYKRKDIGQPFIANHANKEELEKKHNVKVQSHLYDLVGHRFYLVLEAADHMELNSFVFEWCGHQFMRQDFEIKPVVTYDQFMPKAQDLVT